MEEQSDKQVIFLECQCENPFHGIRLERNEKWNETSITVFVWKWDGWWSRLKACWFYLFGSGEIDYDSYMMKPEDREKFLEWLKPLEKT